jgi:hypothetical protein
MLLPPTCFLDESPLARVVISLLRRISLSNFVHDIDRRGIFQQSQPGFRIGILAGRLFGELSYNLAGLAHPARRLSAKPLGVNLKPCRKVAMGKILVDQIRKITEAEKVPVFGIGHASEMANEQPSHRPDGLLPGAQSLIYFGIPIPKYLYHMPTYGVETVWRS